MLLSRSINNSQEPWVVWKWTEKCHLHNSCHKALHQRAYKQICGKSKLSPQNPATCWSFDDFLISLHELVKTWNFCSETCTQKNIWDQIIEGLLDSNTVEALLQESNLTLATAISKCHIQEATKKQRASKTSQQLEHISILHRPRDKRTSVPPESTCPGCGATAHPVGRSQCPAYGQTCFHAKSWPFCEGLSR